MAGELRLGDVHLDHPTEREREKGATSQLTLSLFTPKGTRRDVPLSEDDVVRLIAQASLRLAVLRGVTVRW